MTRSDHYLYYHTSGRVASIVGIVWALAAILFCTGCAGGCDVWDDASSSRGGPTGTPYGPDGDPTLSKAPPKASRGLSGLSSRDRDFPYKAVHSTAGGNYFLEVIGGRLVYTKFFRDSAAIVVDGNARPQGNVAIPLIFDFRGAPAYIVENENGSTLMVAGESFPKREKHLAVLRFGDRLVEYIRKDETYAFSEGGRDWGFFSKIIGEKSPSVWAPNLLDGKLVYIGANIFGRGGGALKREYFVMQEDKALLSLDRIISDVVVLDGRILYAARVNKTEPEYDLFFEGEKIDSGAGFYYFTVCEGRLCYAKEYLRPADANLPFSIIENGEETLRFAEVAGVCASDGELCVLGSVKRTRQENDYVDTYLETDLYVGGENRFDFKGVRPFKLEAVGGDYFAVGVDGSGNNCVFTSEDRLEHYLYSLNSYWTIDGKTLLHCIDASFNEYLVFDGISYPSFGAVSWPGIDRGYPPRFVGEEPLYHAVVPGEAWVMLGGDRISDSYADIVNAVLLDGKLYIVALDIGNEHLLVGPDGIVDVLDELRD